MRGSSSILKCFAVTAFLSLPVPGQADESAGWDLGVDEIAKELSNPVTALASFSNDFQYRTYQGSLPDADRQTSWIYELEASIPIPLRNGKNFLMSVTIPFNLNQPVWETWFGHPIWEVDRSYADFLIRQSPQVTPDSGRFLRGHDHVGDVSFDLAYGGVSGDGFISKYGMVFVLPSSQDLSAARQQFLMGPEVAFGKSADWGVLGASVTHFMRVSGDSDFDTNETNLEVFFAYGLGNGWQITSSPVITYDWEADSGNELLLPIGGGISKTMMLGRMPFRMGFELQYFVETSSRLGQQWLFTFNLTPVMRNPFRK
jgi:hypothetical protein